MGKCPNCSNDYSKLFSDSLAIVAECNLCDLRIYIELLDGNENYYNIVVGDISISHTNKYYYNKNSFFNTLILRDGKILYFKKELNCFNFKDLFSFFKKYIDNICFV